MPALVRHLHFKVKILYVDHWRRALISATETVTFAAVTATAITFIARTATAMTFTATSMTFTASSTTATELSVNFDAGYRVIPRRI